MPTCPNEYEAQAQAVQANDHNTPVEFPAVDDSAAAGDWALFRRRCKFIESNSSLDAGYALALKQRFALAYLANRAQVAKGVYLRLRPSVFSPVFIEQLAQDNMKARYARYPWLERLTQLLQQLDSDQYSADAQHASMVATPRPRPALRVVPAALV